MHERQLHTKPSHATTRSANEGHIFGKSTANQSPPEMHTYAKLKVYPLVRDKRGGECSIRLLIHEFDYSRTPAFGRLTGIWGIIS
jgi:hypothetical protein